MQNLTAAHQSIKQRLYKETSRTTHMLEYPVTLLTIHFFCIGKMLSTAVFAVVLITATNGAVFQEQYCANAGGQCSIGCSGTTKKGLCPSQASNVLCCVKSVFQEAPCGNAGGSCATSCAGGTFKSGLCPSQASDVRCCVKSGSTTGSATPTGTTGTGTTGTAPATGSTTCPLVILTPSEFVGGQLRVHQTFVAAIDRINGYAKAAGVKIHITSSYRKDSNVAGAIVPPASKSNHMSGHAIDFNIAYSGGLCNAACLGSKKLPTEIANFINKVRTDGSLRWGGDFGTRDPVHIDDGLNVKNKAEWDRQYVDSLKYC